MQLFEAVCGRKRGHIPTEETVSLRRVLDAKPSISVTLKKETYHTPTNSILTSCEEAFLNAAHSVHIFSLYSLYAIETCWSFESLAGSRPTYDESG